MEQQQLLKNNRKADQLNSAGFFMALKQMKGKRGCLVFVCKKEGRYW
jgi:hypothetical protein